MPLSAVPPFHAFLRDPESLPWLQASHPARKGTPPVPPSYRASMDAQVRRYQREAQLPGITSFAQLSANRNWVSEQMGARGVATARILREDFALQHLRDALEGIDACVIKPRQAHSSRGVLSLRRLDELTFHCLQRSEERRVGKECRSRWSPYQ